MADLRAVEQSEQAPAPDTSLSVEALFRAYLAKKEHPEYLAFERAASSTYLGTQATSAAGSTLNSWDLVADAIEGTGGFADGAYIVPHRRERGLKLAERVSLAVYDNFAKTICDTPWDSISKERDMIRRESDVPELEDFWADADRRNTSLTDFWEYPARQARSYGTAWVFLDRPVFDPLSQRENLDPSNRPYAYCVQTRDVVYWEFDDDYNLTGVVVQEWLDIPDTKPNLRVWTKDAWAVYQHVKGKDKEPDTYLLIGFGENTIGVVPVVMLFDEDPGPGKALGRSVMLAVARLARDNYNLKSEAREVIRKTAFAVLSVPSKDVTQVEGIVIGTEDVLLYDKDGGEPGYIEANLVSLDKIAQAIRENKEAAYAMAHMSAVSGFTTVTETTSGFHAQTVFETTNKRIAKFAASIETAEVKLNRLYLRYLKRPEESLAKSYSVTYPKDFNLRDLAELQERTKARLEMGLGLEDAVLALTEWYSALYPRRNPAELDALARKGAEAKVSAAMAAPVVPLTAQKRARKLIAQRATA